MGTIKPLGFLGSSRDDLREFPVEVRRAVGAELLRVQLGVMPSDFKPMPAVGKGAYENTCPPGRRLACPLRRQVQ